MPKFPVVLVAVLCLLAFPAFGTTRTWTGAVNSSWSHPNNWSPAGAPEPSDALVFPAGASTSNDLPGFTVGPMTFNGSATLSGNPLTLSGDLYFQPQASFTSNADLIAGVSVRFHSLNTVTFNGALDVNGKTVTLDALNVTAHAVNGSGTISGPGSSVISGTTTSHFYVYDSGAFSGTITNANVIMVNGSLPAAAVHGTLTGIGTIGDATITDELLPNQLHAKSLTIGSTSAQLIVDWPISLASPNQVHVTGPVTLKGTLFVAVLNALPAPGDSFVLIDNQGSGPVNGTFAGLPEGSTLLTPSGVRVFVSYRGGDGNDVTLTAYGTKRWTGSASASWSNPANWSPPEVPAAGEPLIFPAGATTVNDLPSGFAVGTMSFDGSATLSGNPLTLSGGLTFVDSATFTCNADLKLGRSLWIEFPAVATFNGAIDPNGNTLTFYGSQTTLHAVNGSGILASPLALKQLHVAGTGTFSGRIEASPLYLDGGSLPNASVVGDLTGHGTIGNVTITGSLQPAGVLQTKSLTFASPSTQLSVHLSPGGTSDQIQAIGSVTLAGTLSVVFPGAPPTLGQSFTIINNDGSDPVSGTFEGLPEGATVTGPSGAKLTITYRGGDGNDVTLTSAADTSTALAQSAPESVAGQPFTLTATVSSAVGTPTGTVSFGDGATTFGTAPLQSGVATFAASTAKAGPHNVIATFIGQGEFLTSVSGVVVHTVQRGGTITTPSITAGTAVYGQSHFDVSIVAAAPAAGDPAGTVTLRVDGVTFGSGSISGGKASIGAEAMPAGTHGVTAVYSGSTEFEASQGSTTVTIAKAPTSLAVSSDHNPSPAGAPVTLSVTLSSAGPSLPSGTLTVMENGSVVAQQAIAKALSLVLHPSGGHHSFAITYSGDANYLASSANFAQDVAAPMLTANSVRAFEGDSGLKDVAVPVSLSSPSSDPINVPWHTADGTAHSGVDYQQASGTLTFAPGETFHTVIVHVIGNTKKEDDKTFSIVFDAAANVQIGTSSATVTIANDDDGSAPPPTRHRGVRH
jgi:hypothetical protein